MNGYEQSERLLDNERNERLGREIGGWRLEVSLFTSPYETSYDTY